MHTESAIQVAIIPPLEISDTGEVCVGIPGMDNVGGWHQCQAGIRAVVIGVKADFDLLVIFHGIEPGITGRGIRNIPGAISHLKLRASWSGYKEIQREDPIATKQISIKAIIVEGNVSPAGKTASNAPVAGATGGGFDEQSAAETVEQNNYLLRGFSGGEADV